MVKLVFYYGYPSNLSFFHLRSDMDWEIEFLYHLRISLAVGDILRLCNCINFNLFRASIMFSLPLFNTKDFFFSSNLHFLSNRSCDCWSNNSAFALLREADHELEEVLLLDCELFKLVSLLDERILLAKLILEVSGKYSFWLFFNVQNSRILLKEDFIFSLHVPGIFCQTCKLIIDFLQFLENNCELIA